MNPSTGMFISMDKYQGTINDPISLHKYLYANSNPVMYSDPTGYSSYTLAETMETVTIMEILATTIVPNIGPALKIIAFLTTSVVVADYTMTVIPDMVDTVWGLLNGTAGVGDVTWGIREDVVFNAEDNASDKENTKEESTPGSPNNNKNKNDKQKNKRKTVEDITKDAKDTTRNNGKTRNLEKSGGYDKALRDFDDLQPTNTKNITTKYGRGKYGTLDDGTTISVRPGSQTGGATLEIKIPGQRLIKIRY